MKTKKKRNRCFYFILSLDELIIRLSLKKKKTMYLGEKN